jgi:hypothetical protein
MDFVTREGQARVPQSHLEDGYHLGQWVNVQRLFRGAGRLSDERAARLALLPGWDWHSPDTAWEQNYSALERFVAREGHARLPSGHVEDGYRLGQWVVVQRSFRKQGRLPDERGARLAALPGWAWNAKNADWDRATSFSSSSLLEKVTRAYPRAMSRTATSSGSGWSGSGIERRS